MADPKIQDRLNKTVEEIGVAYCGGDTDCEAKVRAPINKESAGMNDEQLAVFEENVFNMAFTPIVAQCRSQYSTDAMDYSNPKKPVPIKWPKADTYDDRVFDCYITAITGNAAVTQAVLGKVKGVPGGRESVATKSGNLFYPELIKYLADRARQGEKVVEVEKVVYKEVSSGGSVGGQITGAPTGLPDSIEGLMTRYAHLPEHLDEVIRLYVEASELTLSDNRGEIAKSIVDQVEPFLKGTDERSKAAGLLELQKRFIGSVLENEDTAILSVPANLFDTADSAKFGHLRRLYRQALQHALLDPESAKIYDGGDADTIKVPLADHLRTAVKDLKSLRGIDVRKVESSAGIPTKVILTSVGSDGERVSDDTLKDLDKKGARKDGHKLLAIEIGLDPKSDRIRLGAAQRLFDQAIKLNPKILDSDDARNNAISQIAKKVKESDPPKNAYLLMVTKTADNGDLTFKTLPPDLLEGWNLHKAVQAVEGGMDGILTKMMKLYNEAIIDAGEGQKVQIARDLARTMGKIFDRPRDEMDTATHEFTGLVYKGKVGDSYVFTPTTGSAAKDKGASATIDTTTRYNGEDFAVGVEGKVKAPFYNEGGHWFGFNLGVKGGHNVGQYAKVDPVQDQILAGDPSNGNKNITALGDANLEYLYSTGEDTNGVESVGGKALVKGNDLLGMQELGAWGGITYRFTKAIAAIAEIGLAKLFTIEWNPSASSDQVDDEKGYALDAKVGGSVTWGEGSYKGNVEATFDAVKGWTAANAIALNIDLAQSFGLIGTVMKASANFNVSKTFPKKGEDPLAHSGKVQLSIPFAKVLTLTTYAKYAAADDAQTSYSVGATLKWKIFDELALTLGIGHGWLAEGDAKGTTTSGRPDIGGGDVATGTLQKIPDRVMEAFERSGWLGIFGLTFTF